MFFQNVFRNRKHVANQFKQAKNYFVTWYKELSVQRFVKVFDQNQKHVEARNQRTGTPVDLLYRGSIVRSSHRKCV